MKKLFALLLILLLTSVVFAHGDEAESLKEQIYKENPMLGFMYDNPPLNFLLIGFVLTIGILAFSIFFLGAINEKHKKILFALIVISIALPTLYLAFATVYENLTSVTGGPVHWHADFEIFVCGDELELKESEGLEGKVGTELVHAHNDYRIHVEGTLLSMSQASLGNFFSAIGGEMTDDSLEVRLTDGTVGDWHNNDLCSDGRKGSWKMYINDVQQDFNPDYVISPFANVPPGDHIKLVFE